VGYSNASPNTSNPGPKFALVAGAFKVTCLSGGMASSRNCYWAWIINIIGVAKLADEVGERLVRFEAVLLLYYDDGLGPAADEFDNVYACLRQ
jgi:hypothetical protein